LEVAMSTDQFSFLVLVCGAFATLAVGLAAATIRYHQWHRQAVSAESRPGGRTTRRAR
jgi:hypothetical protein